MKENKLIIIIIVLSIILAGTIGVLLYINSQETEVVKVKSTDSNNSTNNTNINNTPSTKKVSAKKEYCEFCEIWTTNMDKHIMKSHTGTCKVCGKKIWEDASHIDGSPYHSAKEYDGEYGIG